MCWEQGSAPSLATGEEWVRFGMGVAPVPQQAPGRAVFSPRAWAAEDSCVVADLRRNSAHLLLSK